jgi:hypothetical protein
MDSAAANNLLSGWGLALRQAEPGAAPDPAT